VSDEDEAEAKADPVDVKCMSRSADAVKSKRSMAFET
jgi:hypothetical protein